MKRFIAFQKLIFRPGVLLSASNAPFRSLNEQTLQDNASDESIIYNRLAENKKKLLLKFE